MQNMKQDLGSPGYPLSKTYLGKIKSNKIKIKKTCLNWISLSPLLRDFHCFKCIAWTKFKIANIIL